MPRERQAVHLNCAEGSSKTKQSFKDDSDINVIVNRWLKTGEQPDSTRFGQYGDFSGATTFQDALERIDDAERMFDAMSSEIRHRFHNNPDELLTFVNDPANQDEARELGLAEPLVANPIDELVEGIATAMQPPAPGAGGIQGGGGNPHLKTSEALYRTGHWGQYTTRQILSEPTQTRGKTHETPQRDVKKIQQEKLQERRQKHQQKEHQG